MHFREALTHLHSPLHGFRQPQRNNSEHDATASRSNVHSGSQVRVELFHHPQASGEGKYHGGHVWGQAHARTPEFPSPEACGW